MILPGPLVLGTGHIEATQTMSFFSLSVQDCGSDYGFNLIVIKAELISQVSSKLDQCLSADWVLMLMQIPNKNTFSLSVYLEEYIF